MPSKFQTPRGTQDMLPSETRRWHTLEDRIRWITKIYGYSEIRTPVFELKGLFVRGVGDTSDIVEKEMYEFLDKGQRELALRPELTAPVMRALLQAGLLPGGLHRVYYVGPIFRYERPQAGRYRQSHQFGVEFTGYAGAEADFEVISMASDFLSRSRAKARLQLNSIGDERCRPAFREALIKHFSSSLNELSEDSRRRLMRNPLRLLDSKAEQDRELIETAPSVQEYLCSACSSHFLAVRRYLDDSDIIYDVNPRIVRGLDYYNRTVFEFVSERLGAQSTVCAGGRYDGLIQSLGGPPTPAVGFALGMERLLSITPESSRRRRQVIQAIALGAAARERLVPVIAQLRRKGKTVLVDYRDLSISTQLSHAVKNGAEFALIVADQDTVRNSQTLRDLETHEEYKLPFTAGASNITDEIERINREKKSFHDKKRFS